MLCLEEKQLIADGPLRTYCVTKRTSKLDNSVCLTRQSESDLYLVCVIAANLSQLHAWQAPKHSICSLSQQLITDPHFYIAGENKGKGKSIPILGH